MARSKGSFGLAGAVEPKAAAPLDARAVVKNMEELTAVGSFPYPYIGMETYVVSEGKKYRLIGNDPTVSSNWEEVGVGGGHTIEDPEGTALTQRDTLQFGGDLEVSDDDENEKTVVSPHELTAAELAEIVTPLPSVPVNMPILFDETGTERVVGWYRLANGTKKPMYEKTVQATTPSSSTNNWMAISSTLGSNVGGANIVDIISCIIDWDGANGRNVSPTYFNAANNFYSLTLVQGYFAFNFAGTWFADCPIVFTVQYTKTTDTPS